MYAQYTHIFPNYFQRSNQGAFTPFKTTAHVEGEITPRSSYIGRHRARSSQSTSSSTPRQNLSGIKFESSSLRSPDVMSARKSLLGKLTSVAQQHAKKILDRSARQREGRAERMAKRLQLKRKLEEEEDDEDEEEEDDDEDDENEEVEDKKDSKSRGKARKKHKAHRTERVESQKNRKQGRKHAKEGKARSFMSKRRSSLSRLDKSQKVRSKVYMSGGLSCSEYGMKSIKNKSQVLKDDTKIKGRSKEGKETVKKSVQAESKPRRPYKVRPIERVRTRGYSLLLASKQAMRRAKKDNGAHLKNKTDLATIDMKERDDAQMDQTWVEHSEGEDIESDRELSSKRHLDKKHLFVVGIGEKRKNPHLGEDSFSVIKKRSGSVASETESVPSRRSSRESFTSKPSPARTVRRSKEWIFKLQ